MCCPPECLASLRSGGAAADLWAFGVLLWELSSGSHPVATAHAHAQLLLRTGQGASSLEESEVLASLSLLPPPAVSLVGKVPQPLSPLSGFAFPESCSPTQTTALSVSSKSSAMGGTTGSSFSSEHSCSSAKHEPASFGSKAQSKGVVVRHGRGAHDAFDKSDLWAVSEAADALPGCAAIIAQKMKAAAAAAAANFWYRCRKVAKWVVLGGRVWG
mmetsp:Transcript_30785/g.62558  ORF Transcript_30785/g.62558 Transcript_30785/m.62558 type:complete len:215 (-) Transcript_30785:766-1410(-)